ncbi:MAG: HAMP domain-containing protein [Thermoplasmata archaeon]
MDRLKNITAIVEAMNRGDFTKRAPVTDANDEIDALARNLNEYLEYAQEAEKKRETLTARIMNIIEVTSAVEQGDFSKACVVSEPGDEIDMLSYGINKMIESLKKATEDNLKYQRDLKQRLAESEKLSGELKQKLEVIQKQQEVIRKLQTPIIQVWENVLVVPLVGVLDSQRAMDMMNMVLNAIVELNAKIVILDITGIAAVDTKTADYFIKTVKAITFIGAEALLSGIRPEVAQTLCHIGVEFGNIKITRTLKDALMLALEKSNYKIITRRE